MNDIPTLLDWTGNLTRGLGLTLVVTVLGAILMLLLSVVLGLAARSPRLWLRGTARTVVEFFRGTSLLVQLWWLFFALPLLGIRFEPLLVAVIALGLNYGAYGSEVVRGSLNAVPVAQWEAATALNMSHWQRMRRVIWPQALVLMIPPFNNLLIQLLKSTPLIYTISLVDLTAMGEAFRYAGGSTLAIYGTLLAIYLALAYAMTFVMSLLEAAAKARLGRGRGLRDALEVVRPAVEVKAG
ncbi:MAG: amino acid ABC transporter permease [Pseudonocardiaceae bacterium]